MTEIEKMYENANIKQDRMCEWTCKDSETCNLNCEHYGSMQLYYPPFTAEKQIELIKWLIRNKRLCIRKADYNSNFYMDVTYNRGNGVDNPKFESCLASLINDIWQSLTSQEKVEIRNILK